MSRLSDLYKAVETLRKEGLAISEELEKQVSELEEEIIKKEILPKLIDNITPALKPVERELVLVVDYVPGRPLSVHLSRKRNFAASIEDAKEIVLDPEVEHSTRNTNSEVKIEKSPASKLSIHFPNGSVIAERKAVDTLFEFIKRVGVAEVRKVVEDYELKFCKVPVISNRKDQKYGSTQKDLGNGWYLITHSNNDMKKKFIETVSDALKLGVVVKISK